MTLVLDMPAAKKLPRLLPGMRGQFASLGNAALGIGLLLGRLMVEAPDDPASVFGAAMGEGRFLAFCRSEGNTLAQTLRKPAEELTREDALHVACAEAYLPHAIVRGGTKPIAAAGFATSMEYLGVSMTEGPLHM